jgi:hypothetical protein
MIADGSGMRSQESKKKSPFFKGLFISGGLVNCWLPVVIESKWAIRRPFFLVLA